MRGSTQRDDGNRSGLASSKLCWSLACRGTHPAGLGDGTVMACLVPFSYHAREGQWESSAVMASTTC